MSSVIENVNLNNVVKQGGHRYDAFITDDICEFIYNMDFAAHMNCIMDFIDKGKNFRISSRNALFVDIVFDHKDKIICVYQDRKFVQCMAFEILFILSRIFKNKIIFFFTDNIKQYFMVNKIIENGHSICELNSSIDESVDTHYVLIKHCGSYKRIIRNFCDLDMTNYNFIFDVREELKVVYKRICDTNDAVSFHASESRIQFMRINNVVFIRLLDCSFRELELIRYLISMCDDKFKIVIILLNKEFRWMYSKNYQTFLSLLEFDKGINHISVNDDDFKLNLHEILFVNLLICNLNWSSRLFIDNKSLFIDSSCDIIENDRKSLCESVRSVGSFLNDLTCHKESIDNPFIRNEPFGGFDKDI